MDLTLDEIFEKVAWKAFSEYLSTAVETVNDIALRVYIANELRKLKQLENVSDKKIEDTAEIIEATLVETPEEIKQNRNEEEQKEALKKHLQKQEPIRIITAKNYFEKIINKGTMNFN